MGEAPRASGKLRTGCVEHRPHGTRSEVTHGARIIPSSLVSELTSYPPIVLVPVLLVISKSSWAKGAVISAWALRYFVGKRPGHAESDGATSVMVQ